MPYSVQRLVPEHAQAAKALLTCFFQDMADPAVKFWLQRYGAILAAILTVAFVYLPTSAWFALVIAIGGALQFLGYWEMQRYIANSSDTADLYTSYSKPGHLFLTCLDEQQTVVGCVGLKPFEQKPDTAELVRFVVKSDHRGHGLGRMLVNCLETEAIAMGYPKLELRTNNILKAALHFYTRNGFVLQRIQRRHLLRGDLLFFGKDLKP
eukprot:TRINITY_DN5480_c0_g1_i1.p1 TRINITY_DN5480_c0_g1~~TRINITY_DN5480_c0_g1_i1.p1  ORF type:complete len:209 (+),score=35.82 TRINITY_DN5480_c0_g1_i1:108-734(+)